MLGNINNRIVFRVGEPDAKKLQDGFSGFDYTDLQNLGRGEAVVRIEQPQFDCSLDTIALLSVPEEQRELNTASVIDHARKKYASSKDEVERMLLESLNLTNIKEEKKPETTAPKPVVPPEKPIEKVRPVFEKIQPVEIVQKPEIAKSEDKQSTHRYLQVLVKKMAEARGYTAVLEMQLPAGNGQVDVLLSKEAKTIAVEICVTTDAEWEMHNIEKCIVANYNTVISLSGDPKQLEKIRMKCSETIPGFEKHQVYFFTPDALFAFLDNAVTEELPQEQIIKGFRVNVTYDDVTQEEMDRKRASVAQVVMNSLNRKKRK